MNKELNIGGMSCGHCVKAVAQALESVDGVVRADVDLESGTAKVELSGDVSSDRLIAAVKEEGYEASLAGG